MDSIAAEMLSVISQKVSIVNEFLLVFRSIAVQILVTRESVFQVPCIPSHKYACPQELLRLHKVLERLLMFTTVSSSWKPPASPPSLAQGSVKRKGELSLFSSNSKFFSIFRVTMRLTVKSHSGCRVFHLRTTILPAEEDMPAIMASFKKFNDEFMDQYEDHRGYSRM